MNLNTPHSIRNRPYSGIALLVTLLLVLASTGSAIARQAPASWDSTQRTSIESIETATFGELDLDAIAAEDQLNQAFGKPPRFAIPNEVSISPLLHGNWSEIGEISIWRYRVSAEVATSLNFGFDHVFMPKGAKLYIYTVDAASRGEMDVYEVLGPYGTEINEIHRQFWTPIIQGKDVVIELNVPTEARDQASLELIRINQGYRGFGESLQGYFHTDQIFGEGKQSRGDCAKGSGGRSESCNMDVACLADDDPWNDPRRSVGAYTVNGITTCTGSLVNNTANDRRMLFMTATHCEVDASVDQSVVVYWNYEWPTCRTPGEPIGTAVGPFPDSFNSGSTWLASTENPFDDRPAFTPFPCTAAGNCSDVTIIELDDPANPEFDLFWAGWDRRFTPAQCQQIGINGSTEGLCASIHHPGVDEKRITFVDQDFFTDDIALADNVHWRARWHTDPPIVANIPEPQPKSIPPGVTEQGSSGSPLYTADKRLVGVLSGGLAACGVTGPDLSDLYGKLAHAWEGLGTPATRMRDYLDPQNLQSEFIDGIGEPFNLSAAPLQVSACTTDKDVEITISVTSDPTFSGSVTLNSNSAPPGSSTNFSINPINPPGNSTLSIGNLNTAAAGNFMIEVLGVNPDWEESLMIPFVLASAAPAGTTLTAPANGAGGVSTSAQLSWQAIPNAVSYLVEVADNPDFVSPVFNDSTTATEITVPGLQTVTTYYWRVTAENACGAGAPSAVFSFTTANQFCSAPGTPLLDPDAGGGSAFDSIFAIGGFVDTIEVELDLDHTWVGDTRVVLTHIDSGISATLYDRPGVPATTVGCNGDNIQATFSDEATVLAEDECVTDGNPGLSGTFLPIDPLNSFSGLAATAEWRLEYYDDEPAGTDEGVLNSWCISIANFQEEIFADGFETPLPSM